MNRITKVLFSLQVTVILMTIFAVAIGWATFIENDFGTETAKKLVYVSFWFELLLWLIAINLFGNMFKHQLFRKKKLTILLFHLAFLFILAGGALTRYMGYEGSMHIREGSSANTISLSHNFLKMKVTDGNRSAEVAEKIRLTPKGSNSYKASVEFENKTYKIETEKYIPLANETIIESEEGEPAISLFVMDQFKRGTEHDLLLNEDVKINGKTYSLGSKINGDVSFIVEDGNVDIVSSDVLLESSMMKGDTLILEANIPHRVKPKVIYNTGGHIFVMKAFYNHAAKVLQETQSSGVNTRGLVVKVQSDDQTKYLQLVNKNDEGILQKVRMNDVEIEVSFGHKEMHLPFSLELKKFILDRYPGSHSPSSYASEVVLHDQSNHIEMPYRIYMNNILKYKGFRFFQSSYDQDEKGTILTVSHDFWGTFVSYFGYLIMAIGMALTLFNKNSRFLFLIRKARELKAARNSAKIFIVLVALSGFTTPIFATSNSVPKEHVQELNSLLVQDLNGRVEPFVTMSSDVLRKLHRSEKYEDLSAVEVIMSMMANPSKWQMEPIIKISNGQLAKELGASGGYISFQNMFNQNGYRIKNLVDKTYHKSPTSRTKYDKEVINLDERVNVCYQLFQRQFLHFFPIPGDASRKWSAVNDFPVMLLSENDVNPVIIFKNYLASFKEASLKHNWSRPADLLLQIKSFQKKTGGSIIPNRAKVNLEVLYSKLNLFGKLSRVYQIIGLLLLILNFLLIFKSQWSGKGINLFGFIISTLTFVVYTVGIGMRWYISGHAPWSNGYETMIFVGWATALAGLIFSRQSMMTLAVTNFLSGMMLMVAGLSWMNPEITPLVPVLKSYWLIIHVAVITSSYGFLAIGAFLGFINLLLILFRSKENAKSVSSYIQEINIIIEITFLIGLILLVIGSFLGGVWANESWGRYWGWDPKETWALVTILIYSVVVHLKRIPSFKSDALFNALALVSFASVLMTFFGVNYYLSGLHSYAQGDTPPIPTGIYYAASIVIILISSAYLKESSLNEHKK